MDDQQAWLQRELGIVVIDPDVHCVRWQAERPIDGSVRYSIEFVRLPGLPKGPMPLVLPEKKERRFEVGRLWDKEYAQEPGLREMTRERIQDYLKEKLAREVRTQPLPWSDPKSDPVGDIVKAMELMRGTPPEKTQEPKPESQPTVVDQTVRKRKRIKRRTSG